MKVLFVAFQFPPLNMGGTKRPKSFAENLSKFEIEPLIITLGPNSYDLIYPNASVTKDNNPFENLSTAELDSNTSLTLNGPAVFFRIFFNIYRGSEHTYWKNNFLNKVDQLMLKNDIKAIFVTAPPFGMMKLALQVSEKYDLPLIIDMRDAWLLWNSNPYGTYFHYLLTKRAERKYFKAASAVISTSKETIKDWVVTHPDISNSKYHYIPNGFEIDYIDAVPEILEFIPGKAFVNISYVGSFYYHPATRDGIFTPWWKRKGHRKLQFTPRKQDWLYRSPYFIFKTFKTLFDLYPELRSSVHLNFAGSREIWLDSMIDEFGLNDVVKHFGFINLQDSLKMQRESDFLLLTSAKVINGRDCFIAGKTFEYFHSGKPILAFVADGAQKDVMEESGNSIILDPDDYENNAQKLHEIFTKGIKLKVNSEFVKSHNRLSQSKNLSEIIKKVIKG